MVRNIRVLWAMGWHYITHSKKREIYRVDNKTLTSEQKQQNRAVIYVMMQELARRMIKAAGTTIEVKGKENLPTKGPVVYMATHKGLFDTPVLAVNIDEPLIFIGKEELKKMPIMGKWFEATGSIYLARDDMRQSLKAIMDGIQELKEGQSIVIFPEGTRNPGNEMGEFKAGSFKLATKAKVPIVPIAIQGTQNVLEANKMRVVKATVKMNIGKMIDVAAMDKEELKSLPQTTQDYVRELLDEIS